MPCKHNDVLKANLFFTVLLIAAADQGLSGLLPVTGLCRDGILRETTCCSKTCGRCSGSGCGSVFSGSAAQCCAGRIRGSGRICRALGDTACVLPSPRNQNTSTSELGQPVVKDLCLPGNAGFGDRFYLYSRILELDQYTNVTLHVPERSCDAFNWKHHNEGFSICNKSWDNYFVFPANVKPDYPTKAKGCKTMSNSNAYGEIFRAPTVAHVSPPKVVEVPWGIPLACNEHMRIPSLTAHPPVLLLHIRRGDIMEIKSINNAFLTSVAHVNETWHRVRHQYNTTVFSTNEKDPTYLSALTNALQQSQQLDKLLEEAGCGNDSFCVKCNIMDMTAKHLVKTLTFGHH